MYNCQLHLECTLPYLLSSPPPAPPHAPAATLSEFEMDAEALDDLLHWLVQGAVRLKALLADTAGGVGVAAETWTIPAGIMPPFPEKSSFGQVSASGLRLVLAVGLPVVTHYSKPSLLVAEGALAV